MANFLFVAILLSVADKLWAAQICCPGLQCYDDSPPYSGMPLPQCPEDMNIVMKVYTRENPTTGETITRNTIPSSFKGKTNSVIVVHGWQQPVDLAWLYDTKDAALAKGDYNVIIVNWTDGAQNPLYIQPASNTRTVGGEISLVVNNTINNGNSSKDMMYCVGHSLGAHVCGQAGQRVKFGRITGLDPAGVFFENRESSVGLNPSCADLVDVIHTNGLTLTALVGAGTLKVLGHIDFYPNGGSTQPGCILNPSTKIPSLKDFTHGDLTISCSHNRAVILYIESIRTPCFLSRFSCSNANQLSGSCNLSSNAVQSMGFNADTYPGRGIFYLTTNANPPYCRG